MLINLTLPIWVRGDLFVQDPMDIWFGFMFFTRFLYPGILNSVTKH